MRNRRKLASFLSPGKSSSESLRPRGRSLIVYFILPFMFIMPYFSILSDLKSRKSYGKNQNSFRMNFYVTFQIFWQSVQFSEENSKECRNNATFRRLLHSIQIHIQRKDGVNNIFIIKGFLNIVFIFIFNATTFRPICPPAFFSCLSNSGTFRELRTLLNPRGSPVLILFAITGYKC